MKKKKLGSENKMFRHMPIWDIAFWAQGYYVEIFGSIIDKAVQNDIKEQEEESRKEDSWSTAL